MAQELRPNIFPALRYRDADAAVDSRQSAFGVQEKEVHRSIRDPKGHLWSFGTSDPYTAGGAA